MSAAHAHAVRHWDVHRPATPLRRIRATSNAYGRPASMTPEQDAMPADADETTRPETPSDVGGADTLRWVPIARPIEPAPETRRYGNGL